MGVETIYTREMRAAITRLRDQGETWVVIAEKVGVSHDSLRYYRRNERRMLDKIERARGQAAKLLADEIAAAVAERATVKKPYKKGELAW